MNSKLKVFSVLTAILVAVSVVGCGPSESATAPLVQDVKKTAPVITKQPQSVDQELGGAAIFEVTAVGGNLKYQWVKDGVDVSGANGPTFVISSVSNSDAKSSVFAVVSNDKGSVESEPASVFVHKKMPAQFSVGYMELKENSVYDFLPGQDFGKLTVSVVSGPDIKIKVGDDNVVRYLSPTERYGEAVTTVAFQDVETGLRYLVDMPWRSYATPAVSSVKYLTNKKGKVDVEPGFVKLSVNTDVPDGYVNSSVSSFVYTIKTPKKISSSEHQVYFENSVGIEDVTKWFEINSATGIIHLKNEHLLSFLAKVRDSGSSYLEFILSTEESDSYIFSSPLRYADSILTVKMVDGKGSPDLSMVGKEFLVTGVNTGFSDLVKVDGSAEFVLKNIPVDNYSITEVLLDPGFPRRGFAPFNKNAKNGVLTLVTSPVVYNAPISTRTTFVDDGEPAEVVDEP